MGVANDIRKAIERGVFEGERAALAAANPSGEIVAIPADSAALTKEQATADTIRALKQCYPDRWEAVWNGLQKESSADVLAKATGELAKANPGSAAGAAIGAILGAVIGGGALPPIPALALPRGPGGRRR